MSKSKGHGRWRSDGHNRMNIGSSVKGKPISNPIPFSEDDEFPFKPVGPGMPVPQGSEGVEKEMHLRLSADSTLRREGIDVFLDNLSLESETAPPQPSYAPPAPPTSQPTPLGVSTSIQSGSSARGRRPSLRNVFGKFFRRKHKPSASSTSGVRAGQHRSVPTGLSRSPKGTLSKQRSASLPINEFNRALHSHSASTEEFPLASTNINGDITQANWQTRPRGATTPSGLWVPNRATGYVDWTGLSPRPASSHARGSRVFHDDEPEAAVGIALTSGSHPRRKSRSVGELRGTTSASNIRRRSDEIRYWRESYDPVVLSPVSTNKPEGEEADEQDVRAEEPPPQPFNFGLMGEMAGMKITQAASLETRVLRLEARVRGMEKAVFRSRSHASTDRLVFPDPPPRSSRRGRRTSLTLSATDHPEPSFAKRQESRETQRRQNSRGPVSRGSQSLYESSRPSTVSTNNSYYPFFDNASRPQVLTSPEQTTLNSSPNVPRPLSTSTTIRGMPPSSPALPKDGHLTSEHYTALLNMILAEQAARQDLETVVVDLQARLQALHSAGTEHADPRRVGFSSSDPDNSSDDEGRFGQNDDDDDFQTPAEERPEPPFGGEIFGEISSNRAAGPRIGPRTLSLSQMTLGKGGSPV